MPSNSSGSCASCATGSLGRAAQIRSQQQRQRGWKLYSFHAPEVECTGKGKAAAPYEFGVKASIVTNNRRARGGLFVLHARALPDNPYDGHTLRDVSDRIETLTRLSDRAGLCRQRMSRPRHAKYPSRLHFGREARLFGAIKRELRRRSAIKPIIGHLKAEGHLGRCYLKGPCRRRRQRRSLRRELSPHPRLNSSWGCYRERSPVHPSSIRLLNGRHSIMVQSDMRWLPEMLLPGARCGRYRRNSSPR